MKPKVLIIDDSLTVRMDLAEAFEQAGFAPVPAASLGEARDALSREPFAIVVLDVLLPDGDGIDLLRAIRTSDTPDLPVMLLSTETDVRDRIRGLQTGANEYVGKPYNKTYVVSRARALLRERVTGGGSAEAPILIIDDSPTFLNALRDAVQSAGFGVLTADSGEMGLQLAADVGPRAILVDGVLPGIDGATVIRRVRLDAALRATPCLLLTAAEDAGAELRALDAGADAFVRKDQDVQVILARFTAMMRSAADRPSSAAGTNSVFGPKRILAVDDSPTYLHGLAEALAADGYDLVLARSGEEALELLAVQPMDCILLDLRMPGIGGKETCVRIKAAPGLRDIPLLILTAMDGQEALIDGLATGADDYICKSGEFEVLKARVRAQLRRKQFEDENRRMREELVRTELEALEARAAREIAEQRAELVAELERKNRELEAFSYSVSHDLRAPLRSIDGFSQALLDSCGDRLEETERGYLGRVRAAAQRMAELIDDLLQLSRVGRLELSPQLIDLSAIASSVAAELRTSNPGRQVEVAIQEGVWAHADRGLMHVVFENLLGNAWKFSGTVDASRVEFGLTRKDGADVFFVRDNGVGFDMNYAKKLFGPFQRLHADTDFPGTGIGLATVQRILDRHHGQIWAESAVGCGATFYFSLPDGIQEQR